MPNPGGRYVLPLTAVTDQYQYFSCPNTVNVNVQAFNNGIDIGFGYGLGPPEALSYLPTDEYLALTTLVGPRSCDGIRFKNHVPGQAGQIQITAQGVGDSGPLGGASYQTNFLTVNPDGSIGATFTGNVRLPLAPSSGAPLSSVEWVDLGNTNEPGGTQGLRGFIETYQQPIAPGNPITMQVGCQDQPFHQGGLDTQLIAGSINDVAALSVLNVFAQPGGANKTGITFQQGSGNVAETIIDSLRNSIFPTLLGGAQKIRLAWGTVVNTYPGASTFSNTVAVNPGFGNNPIAAFVMGGVVSPGGAFSQPYITGVGSNSFNVQCQCTNGTPGAGATSTLFWFALG